MHPKSNLKLTPCYSGFSAQMNVEEVRSAYGNNRPNNNEPHVSLCSPDFSCI